MIQDLKTHYRELLATHGDSPQAVQYSSLESQERRFDILAEIGNLNGCRILDFGCGTGQLNEYLIRKGIKVQYSGVDIVDEFLTLCRNKFPHSRYGKFEEFEGEMFDYIMVAGVFNNRINDNVFFYQNTIKSLFGMALRGLSFNMMSAYVDYEDEGLFYEYPEKVFAFLKHNVTPFVKLRNDYEVKLAAPPFDFTVYAYRGGQ